VPRILVDAANLKPGQTGIRSYTIQLVKALAERGDLEVIVATSHPASFDEIPNLEIKELSARTRSFAHRVIWREAHLAALARRARADVVLANTIEAAVRPLPVPLVVVLHDVGAIVAPALYGRARWLRFSLDTPRVLRSAAHVVSVSMATKLDAYMAAGLDASKCTVIGSGARERSLGEWGPDERDPYVLYAGTLFGNKNVNTLVAAFGVEWPRGRVPRLVVAGPASRGELHELQRAAMSAGTQAVNALQHVGFVSEAALASLYERAAAFAFPAVYEGFGMPMVEAMLSGVPVVASGVPSLSEAGGTAFHAVPDPTDPRAWARALSQVVFDSQLAKELSALGREHARQFVWSAVGERCGDVLHAVAGRASGSAAARVSGGNSA